MHMAMAWIWTGMAAVSLIFAAWNGTMDAVGAAGIRRTRYTIPAALTADLAAFVAAAWAVRLCFG